MIYKFDTKIVRQNSYIRHMYFRTIHFRRNMFESQRPRNIFDKEKNDGIVSKAFLSKLYFDKIE
jgi:hypothetical protein